MHGLGEKNCTGAVGCAAAASHEVIVGVIAVGGAF